MNEIETFYGLVENTLDALRIFQMCREGRLNRVRRRLHERERKFIRSASVFVFDEEESGIRRWTDGRLWSPSRILGNFLIYRELEKKGGGTRNGSCGTGGSRDRNRTASNTIMAQKRSLPSPNISSSQMKEPKLLPKNEEPSSASELEAIWDLEQPVEQFVEDVDSATAEDALNWLIAPQKGIDPKHFLSPNHTKTTMLASFSSSDPISEENLSVLKRKKLSNNHKGRYVFKVNGFIKKTISIQLEGHTHHLVAYYSLDDFCRGHLHLNAALKQTSLNEEIVGSSCNSNQAPFDCNLMEALRQVPIPVDLMLQQNFRKPAALLASATSTAQDIIADDPDNGEKLITALEYGVINPSNLQSSQLHQQQHEQNGGIIFSSSSLDVNQRPMAQRSHARPRRHSSFHPISAAFPFETAAMNDFSLFFNVGAAHLEEEQSVMTPSESSSVNDSFDFISTINPDQGLILSSSVNDYEELDEEEEQRTIDPLDTELFGNILTEGGSKDSTNFLPCQEAPDDPLNGLIFSGNGAIRGEDFLLSDIVYGT